MADKRTPAGPIPSTARSKYREREDQARRERHQRAALEAGRLRQAASDPGPDDHPAWVRTVIYLMQAIGAEYAAMTIVQGDEGLRCRITRGYGLEESPTRGWPGAAPPDDTLGPASIRVGIDLLCPAPACVSPPTQSVPGASSSFHSLLYPAGNALPLGCLSLYSRTNLSLAADRVAFMHAVADVLAEELAHAGSISSLSR